jgi:arylsulfatase A
MPKGKLYNFAADSQKNNLPSLYPEKLKEMDVIVQREHQHPHVLDWEIVDPKVKKGK